jgi:hypothetical protein
MTVASSSLTGYERDRSRIVIAFSVNVDREASKHRPFFLPFGAIADADPRLSIQLRVHNNSRQHQQGLPMQAIYMSPRPSCV